MTFLLEARSIDAHYGDFQAIDGLTLRIEEGETLAVIGANGAGKSTLLKVLSGLMTTTRGSIEFDGTPVNDVPAHLRVAMGIALTPEGRRIFPSLTVEENLLVGGYCKRPGVWNLSKVGS